MASIIQGRVNEGIKEKYPRWQCYLQTSVAKRANELSRTEEMHHLKTTVLHAETQSPSVTAVDNKSADEFESDTGVFASSPRNSMRSYPAVPPICSALTILFRLPDYTNGQRPYLLPLMVVRSLPAMPNGNPNPVAIHRLAGVYVHSISSPNHHVPMNSQ